MEIDGRISSDRQEIINILLARLEDIKEKMETETQSFIESTKRFTLEWTRREIEQAILFRENGSSQDLKSDNEKISRLKSGLKELPFCVPVIVESYLNRDDLWIHRNTQLQAGVSPDYIEFKKDKMLKEMTTSIRLILGCTTEIFDNINDEEKPEEQGWVKESGRRKYVCFLRFSDEMTACLNRYFGQLEEFFALNYQVKEEISKSN